VKCSKL